MMYTLRSTFILAICLASAVQAQFTYGPEQVLQDDQLDPKEFAADDLDGDGDQDLVTSFKLDGDLLISLNAGNGVDWEEIWLERDLSNPSGVLLLDITGDGEEDIVLAETGADRIIWYANTGGGSFGAMQILNTGMPDVALLTTADFDGDGDADLLSLGGASNIRYHQNLGGSTFAASVLVTGAAGATKVVPGDADGDGDIDFFADGSPRRWHANTGSGTFTLGGIIPTFIVVSGWDMADIDTDGDLDFIASGGGDLYYSVNDGGGVFTFTDPLSELWITRLEMVRDVDQDGDLDFIGRRSEIIPDPLVEPLHYFENQGTGLGGFGQHSISMVELPDAWSYRWLLTDLDTDGDLDIAWVHSQESGDRIIWQGQDTTLIGEFNGPWGIIHAQFRPGASLSIADADDDGSDEAVVYTTSCTLDAGMQLQFDPLQFTGPIPQSKASYHDIDQDGIDDAVFADPYMDSIMIAMGLGGGTFGPAVVLRYLDVLSGATLADADSDGDLDIFYGGRDDVFSTEETVIAMMRNAGGGLFDPPVLIHQPPSEGHTVIQSVGDVDGDGDIDVIAQIGWTDGGGNHLHKALIKDLGAGTYSVPDTLPAPLSDARTIADMNNDGKGDLAVVSNGSWYWHTYDGLAWDIVGVQLPGTEGSWDRFLDLDGDSDPDRLNMDGILHVSWNAGGGAFGTLIPIGPSGGIPGVVDMDHDGVLDLVGFSFAGGGYLTYANWYKGSLSTAIADDGAGPPAVPILFPNPATDRIQVDLRAWSGQPLELSVISAIGRQVLRTTSLGQDRAVLDVSHLAPGVYLLRIGDDGDHVHAARFVVR